jgi:hypothetical protein
MLNPMRVSSKNLLATALLVAACSKDAARKEPVSESAAPSAAGAARPSAQPDFASGRYIGTRHEPLPNGITSDGGALVRIGAADYAFTRVHTPHGDMVWLDSIVAPAGNPPVKIVRAELEIPPLAGDERLLMASCDANGKLDGRVIAIVVNEAKATKFTKVRQAWRADPRHGRFDVIPVAGITCEDPGIETR